MTTTAAAPSLIPEALAAVTVPSFLKAGFRPASFSAVVSPRGCSSVSKRIGSPFFAGISTATISSLNFPAFIAAAVLFWLSAANSSCSSRGISYFAAMFSAVMPMWTNVMGQLRPSAIIESIS